MVEIETVGELWKREGELVRLKLEELPEFAWEEYRRSVGGRGVERWDVVIGMVWNCGRPEDGESVVSLEQGELEKWGWPVWGESMGVMFRMDGGCLYLVKEIVHVMFRMEGGMTWLIPERYLEVIG